MRQAYANLLERRPLTGITVLIIALAVCGCGSQADSYRQRITVEVDTPEGVMTGSSVSEVKWRYSSRGSSRASSRGEAVAVDLPGGRTLFALMTQ